MTVHPSRQRMLLFQSRPSRPIIHLKRCLPRSTRSKHRMRAPQCSSSPSRIRRCCWLCHHNWGRLFPSTCTVTARIRSRTPATPKTWSDLARSNWLNLSGISMSSWSGTRTSSSKVDRTWTRSYGGSSKIPQPDLLEGKTARFTCLRSSLRLRTFYIPRTLNI